MELLPPLRVRLHTDDHEKYGDAQYVYDEDAIVRLPVGEQRDIEATIGMSLLTMMNRGRQTYVDATVAQIWVARRMAGVTETFADFNPIVMLSDWELAGAGGDADPPDLRSSASPAAPQQS